MIRDSALSKVVSDPVERQAVNLVANGGTFLVPFLLSRMQSGFI